MKNIEEACKILWAINIQKFIKTQGLLNGER